MATGKGLGALALAASLTAGGTWYTHTPRVAAEQTPAPAISLATAAPTPAPDTPAAAPPTPSTSPSAIAARSATSRTRLLHFPEDHSIGPLYLINTTGPRAIVDFYFWIDGESWEQRQYLGEARGDVLVPEGRKLWLLPNPMGCRDLSSLAQLPPDALYRITLQPARENAYVNETNMEYLSHLTGLRVLELNQARISPSAVGYLRNLRALKRLRLPMNITDEGLRAISEMTWLEGLYDVGGLASDAGLAHLAELSHLEELLVDSQKTTREGKPVPSPISDAGLAVLSHLPSLTYLALGGGFTDATMTHVATLPNLRILYILHVPISDAGLRHLSSLTRLERLSLSGTPQATDAGLAALLSLHSLKQLNISLAPGSDPQRITDRALVTLSRMHSLESLSITNNDFLSDENIPQLAQLPRLKRLNISTPAYIDNAMDKVFYTSVSLTQLTRKGLLEELSIGGAGVNDKTIGILTQLPHLRKLDLMTYNLTDAGVRQLAALRSLEGLVIHNRRISIGALNSLNALPNLRYLRANTLFRGGSQSLQIGNLTHLETLILSMDFREPQPWCDADLACLSSMTKMGDLQLCGIDNRRSQVTDQGLASLAPLTSLWRLSIRTTRLTNEGLVHLHGLRQLEDLYISGDFGNAGLDQLASLASLRILEISNNRGFSAQSLDQLKARLPNLQLLTIPNNPAP